MICSIKIKKNNRIIIIFIRQMVLFENVYFHIFNIIRNT